MAQSFTAAIEAFGIKTKAKAEAVLKESAQEVFALAQTPQPSVKQTGGSFEQGKIPVDTGILRNSFVSGLNGSTSLSGADAYTAAIAGMEIGDSIFGGWTAEYARAIEYGTENIAGRFFAGNAVRQWQAIVARNAQKAAAQ